MKPEITVFLPYYNDIDYLKCSIESVLTNTFSNFELILLNHNSTDGSRDIAHSFKDARIIHLDVEINYCAGGGILFKKALSIARGKYFKPFCADDVMDKDCLRRIHAYMESNPNIDFSFSRVKYIDKSGNTISIPDFKALDSIDSLKEIIYERNFLCYPASLIKTCALRSITIDNSYILLFDLSLWISLLVKGFEIGFIDQVCVSYRKHFGQMSLPTANNSRLYNLEIKTLWLLFTTITDVDVVKKIWPNSNVVKKLSMLEDIPFVISRELLVNKLYQRNSYSYIHDLLQDEDKSFRIKKIFDYGLIDFRKDAISSISYDNTSDFKSYVYNTPSKYLDMKALAFLMLRSIFKKIKR